MSTTPPEAAAADAVEAPPKKGKRGLLLALLAVPLLLGAGGGAAYVFVPGVGDAVRGMLGGSKAASHEVAAPVVVTPRPVFVDLPEMSITLPNGGQPRQLRIRISLELMRTEPGGVPPDVLSPRVYDALLTYLRTLNDGEVENSLAVDRVRGDLYRRLTLLLGGEVVRDVLITSFVVA